MREYGTVTPYLTVPGVARLIEFLREAFDATERMRLTRPDGSVMHAEVEIGESIVMMGEPTDPGGAKPGQIYLRVADADASYARALAAGATSVMAPTDRPEAGERYGGIKDPCGNLWWPAMKLAPDGGR